MLHKGSKTKKNTGGKMEGGLRFFGPEIPESSQPETKTPKNNIVAPSFSSEIPSIPLSENKKEENELNMLRLQYDMSVNNNNNNRILKNLKAGYEESKTNRDIKAIQNYRKKLISAYKERLSEKYEIESAIDSLLIDLEKKIKRVGKRTLKRTLSNTTKSVQNKNKFKLLPKNQEARDIIKHIYHKENVLVNKFFFNSMEKLVQRYNILKDRKEKVKEAMCDTYEKSGIEKPELEEMCKKPNNTITKKKIKTKKKAIFLQSRKEKSYRINIYKFHIKKIDEMMEIIEQQKEKIGKEIKPRFMGNEGLFTSAPTKKEPVYATPNNLPTEQQDGTLSPTTTFANKPTDLDLKQMVSDINEIKNIDEKIKELETADDLIPFIKQMKIYLEDLQYLETNNNLGEKSKLFGKVDELKRKAEKKINELKIGPNAKSVYNFPNKVNAEEKTPYVNQLSISAPPSIETVLEDNIYYNPRNLGPKRENPKERRQLPPPPLPPRNLENESYSTLLPKKPENDNNEYVEPSSISAPGFIESVPRKIYNNLRNVGPPLKNPKERRPPLLPPRIKKNNEPRYNKLTRESKQQLSTTGVYNILKKTEQKSPVYNTVKFSSPTPYATVSPQATPPRTTGGKATKKYNKRKSTKKTKKANNKKRVN